MNLHYKGHKGEKGTQKYAPEINLRTSATFVTFDTLI